MTRHELPKDVVRFLHEHIDTVPQLEALMLLWERRDPAWSVDELAARLYVGAAAARQTLDHLERHALVVRSGERYALAADHPQAVTVGAVASAYRAQLMRIAELIHGKASPSLREFARSFKLKKDD